MRLSSLTMKHCFLWRRSLGRRYDCFARCYVLWFNRSCYSLLMGRWFALVFSAPYLSHRVDSLRQALDRITQKDWVTHWGSTLVKLYDVFPRLWLKFRMRINIIFFGSLSCSLCFKVTFYQNVPYRGKNHEERGKAYISNQENFSVSRFANL